MRFIEAIFIRTSFLSKNNFRVLLDVLLTLVFANSITSAQRPPHTTLIIFADRPMPEGLWPSIDATLRGNLASGSPEIQALASQTASISASSLPEIQIVRGDQIHAGIVVDQSITVYLHGECVAFHASRFDVAGPSTVAGPLGWVTVDHGHIDPFIHIACASIGQMLAQQSIGRNLNDRNRLMATGISRVLLHEWIHIATQSSHHSRHGITQAEFSVADLLAQPVNPRNHALKSVHTIAPPATIRESEALNGGK